VSTTTTTTRSGRQVETTTTTTTTTGTYLRNERRYDGEVTATYYWRQVGPNSYVPISGAEYREATA
jgi:hypothetical protein